ncbi:MAG: hypothetical protein JWM41_4331 [Gemmatimonadetes bacterium]|nr:hypothetical protein [Gemmatimonadota bacterium]
MDAQRHSITRAAFLRRASSLLAVAVFDRGRLPSGIQRRMHMPLVHPDPRPGITSEHVLTAEAVGKEYAGKVGQAYDAARSYPEIFDGIACACGCSPSSGTHRSLLVCYETMQPTGCHSCQTEGLLVGRLAKRGDALEAIRKAVDKSDS